MGSPLRLTVALAPPPGRPRDDDTVDAAIDAAWAVVIREFEAAEAAMSRFRDDSALTRLNRAGAAGLMSVPGRLRSALVLADRARRVTAGRFEPRIVDALERLGFAAASQRSTPRSGEGTRPAAGTDPDRVVDLDARTGRLALPVPVDLGGLGKGLGLRWAAGPLRTSLRERIGPVALGALLEAGGDLVVDGLAGPGEPWRVGIEDPAGGVGPVAVVSLDGHAAIMTSSVRLGRRTGSDGHAVHHLVDSRTGAPGGDGLAAVTVAGQDPAWCEIWSKALFLEGRGGIAAVARRRGLAAWWVTTDGTVEMTAAARQRTTWVAGEA